VLLVDTNWHNVTHARQEGFQCHYGSVLSDELHESLEMTEFASLLAMTQNDEANSLAADSFGHVFGKENVYQLTPQRDAVIGNKDQPSIESVNGRRLFSLDADFSALALRFAEGEVVRGTKLTEAFGLNDFNEKHPDALLLFFQNGDGEIVPVAVDGATVPEKDVTLFALSK
jgi:hypothetical protein